MSSSTLDAMNIDRATPDDVRAVAQIHVDAWRSAYAQILPADYLASLSVEQCEAMWRKTVESGWPDLLVAKENGTLLGWVSFGACRDEDAPASQAEVWAINVAPSSWSKGVGRQLWSRARELLRQQGYSSCSLWVFPENERAIRFYRSVGFVADTLPPRHFEFGSQQLLEVRYVCRIDG
jgi:L-amino acid N-acyltransferase YncA